MAKAYGAAGQAASALHTMALLQVHQVKALKQLHEGDADPGVLQDLRTATDLALRATKVTARALGQTMSTLVVQERHLWLTLADMRESDKHRFLDSPISQAGLFGEAVEDVGGAVLVGLPHIPKRWRPRAPSCCRSLWILLFRRWWPHHSFPQRRAGWRIFCFLFVLFRHCTQNFNKRAVSFSSGSQEGEDGSVRDFVSTLPSPSLFASGQQGPVRGRDAFSRIPCPTMEPGQCHTTHSDPTSRRTAFRVGPLCSISLPHRGYVSNSPGPACTVPGGLARAPQAVSLAPEDYQTRLRDSVRPASPQVQGHSVHLSVEQGCPCLACRSRGPTGEGRDRAGPSSRDEVRVLQPLLHRTQERWWVTTNPGPLRSEPGPSQAPVQDVDAETHLSIRPSLRLVCSNRPKGRLLPCLDPPSTQTVSPLCVRGASIPVQGPSLRAIPVASCLHQGRRSSPCTVKGSRHSYPQLPRRLAHPGPVSSTVVRTQGYGAQSPQPVGTSGQPGKEQTLPYAEDLFSRHGVGLGQPHSTSLRGACSVNAEMPGVSPAQEGGSTETFSEAPGAYGILSRYHDARIASYETASALASWPSPEMGMAPRHIPGLTHPVLPSHLQPLVGPCFSSGRSSPRASIQAHCCFNRRLCHGLGGPCATGTQPRGSGQGPSCSGISIASSCWQYGLLCAASERCYTRTMYWSARTTLRPLQHCNTATARYINHQGGLRSRRMSQLAPQSLPLESEASEVASRRSCPRRAQPCSRRALTSARPSGRMATPPRGTPADLETLRGRSGRPVCLPGHVSLPVVFLPVRGDPRYRCAGMQLASGLTQICVFPQWAFSHRPFARSGRTRSKSSWWPYWPNRTWFPELMLLATAPPWQIPLRRDLLSQRGGTLWHPRPDLWNLHIWSLDGTRRF